MERLSESQEDYLEEIYVQVLKNGHAKVTEISASLNVRKASVTSALNLLASRGLINYAPYSPITLTEEGRNKAEKILKKHKLLKELFEEILRLDNAQEIACSVDHLISDKNFDKINSFVNSYKGEKNV